MRDNLSRVHVLRRACASALLAALVAVFAAQAAAQGVVHPRMIRQAGATDRQILRWDGTVWDVATEKGQEVFDVRDQGAACDGSTNDAAAIQAAADAADAAGGGVVYIPTASTCDTNSTITVTGNSVCFVSDGELLGTIATGSGWTDGNSLIVFDNSPTGQSGNCLRGLRILGAAALTSGWAVEVVEQTSFKADDVRIINFPNGVRFDGGAENKLNRVVIREAEPATGVGVQIEDSLGTGPAATELNSLLMNAGTDIGAGIKLLKSADTIISNSNIINADICLHAIPGVGDVVGTIHSSNNFYDNCDSFGARLDASAGTVQRFYSVNDWFGSAGIDGFQAIGANINGVSITNCMAILNNRDGLRLDNGNDYSVVGCKVSGNDADDNGDGHGINLGGSVDGVSLLGNRTGLCCGIATETQQRGIQIFSGADNFVIVGNDVSGNQVSGINDGSSGTRTIHSNIGSTICQDNGDDVCSTSTLTVEEADGAPSVGSVSTVQFDQADGFTVTDETGGQVQVDLVDAPDSAVSNAITLDNITQITARSITDLTGVAGRGQLPSEIAYEDENNLFNMPSGTQDFEVRLGPTASAEFFSVSRNDGSSILHVDGADGRLFYAPITGSGEFEIRESNRSSTAFIFFPDNAGTSKIFLASDTEILWDSLTTADTAGNDLGLARDSAGVLKITDGTTGDGNLLAGLATLSDHLAITNVGGNDSGVTWSNGTNTFKAQFQGGAGTGFELVYLGSGAADIVIEPDGDVRMDSGNLAVTGSVNSTVGYQVGGAATAGNYLRGDGSNFVSSVIQAADIPQGADYTWTGTHEFDGIVNVENLNSIRFCDQFASLQACIDDLPASGGIAYAPGDYSISSTLTLDANNERLVCSWGPQGTVFDGGTTPGTLRADGVISWTGAAGGVMVDIVPPTNGKIYGVGIQGCVFDADATNSADIVIRAKALVGGFLRDITMANCDPEVAEGCLDFSSGDNAAASTHNFRSNNIQNIEILQKSTAAGSGIHLQRGTGSTATDVNQNVFDHIKIGYHGEAGVRADASDANTWIELRTSLLSGSGDGWLVPSTADFCGQELFYSFSGTYNSACNLAGPPPDIILGWDADASPTASVTVTNQARVVVYSEDEIHTFTGSGSSDPEGVGISKIRPLTTDGVIETGENKDGTVELRVRNDNTGAGAQARLSLGRRDVGAADLEIRRENDGGGAHITAFGTSLHLRGFNESSDGLFIDASGSDVCVNCTSIPAGTEFKVVGDSELDEIQTDMINRNNNNVIMWKDEFLGGGAVSGEAGDHGWQVTTGAFTHAGAELNHPGIKAIITSTSLNDYRAAFLGLSSAGRSFDPDDTFDLTFIVKPTTFDAANTELRIGLTDDPSASPPSDGIYFEKLFADTNWFSVTRAASTETRTDMGTAVAAGWFTLRIRRIDASTIGFTVDGGTEQTHTTNVPGGGLALHWAIENADATARVLNMDLVDLKITVSR